MQPWVMFVALAGFLGLFAWSAQRRLRMLIAAAPEPRIETDAHGPDHLGERFKQLLIYALGQRKMPKGKYSVAGTAHMFIFFGFVVLLLRTLLLWGRGFDRSFDMFGLLAQGSIVGDVYSVVKDVFASLVVLGCSIFVWLRVVRREKRMSLGIEGLVILGIISTMMVADFIYDGAAIALEAIRWGESVHFHRAEPVGSVVAMGFERLGFTAPALSVIEHSGFWWHALFVLIFLNLLPYSKHFHIITSLPNVFLRVLQPAGALPWLNDIEARIEKEEPIGIHQRAELSWKAVLDTYTCTECGRCSDNCPATLTGKVLSPKHLMMALRENIYSATPRQPLPALDLTKKEPLGASAPEGGYFRTGDPGPLVPNVLNPDVIWACTTCRACEEQCPVLITFVDKIVGMRRAEVLMKNEFPAELQKTFQAIEVNSNPWNLPVVDRGKWAVGLDVRTLSEVPHVPVVFWVGCAASYDDRAKKIARATVRLMQSAGVEFAILGKEEKCTGDPVRRAGHEYLFQILAEQNVQTLKKYEAEKKTIVTTCPHCFNTLLNEYPQAKGCFNVVHHSDFIQQLVLEGKLIPTHPVNAKVVYHDSCYLGRYNSVYESPRQMLTSIPGVELVEVPYWSKQQGLCCGAGGAQMWMEEQNETRVNGKRSLQLLETKADIVASGCPFCMTMLSDGIKAHEREEVKTLDVVEVLQRSVLGELNSIT